MSIEESIAYHSVALQNLADAIRYHADRTATRSPAQIGPVGSGSQNSGTEVEAATNKVYDGKEQQKAAMAAVEADRKPAAESPAEQGGVEPAPAELDYEKDIRPLLVKVGKDKPALVALLAKFGATKGGEISKGDFAAVVKAASEILGG